MSPSDFRRMGRNAFYRGGNPNERNPYIGKPGVSAASHAIDWREGWDQALAADLDAIDREAEAEQEETEKVEEFARLYNLAKDRGLIS